ncbi:MAG: hypothetical protein HKP40_01105 [Litoreibacter sp.]|nr:hypothetical protein [Litoreibacter sp.]
MSKRVGSKLRVENQKEIAPKIVSTRVIVPENISAPERVALSRQIYEVHRKIFSGTSAEEFHLHVLEPAAEATVIQLYLTSDCDIVGYCAFHRYWRRLKGRNVIVLRAEAALMPQYRGRGTTFGFGMIRAFVEKLRHPFTPVYYLGTLVHASSYHLFCKYFGQVFPSPDFEAPIEVQDQARALIDSFPDPAVTGADPFIREVGWVTIETEQERELNKRGNQRDVQFYLERNPGYLKGHGLVVFVPITVVNIAVALLSRLLERALIGLGLRQA